ncbi:TACO1 family protein [Megaselia abdita]
MMLSLRNLLTPVIRRGFHTTASLEAGHSKWANIKHTKALKDGQKSAAFTRISRQIRLAVQEGGPNPDLNTTLRNVIDDALKRNMPMANIKGTIKKCETDKAQLKKYTLEFKALNKIYMVGVIFTDNLTGMKIQIATLLRKAGAAYADSQHLFDSMGIIEAIVPESKKSLPLDKLESVCTDDAIECGAEEVDITEQISGAVQFICDPIELTRISNKLVEHGYQIENSEHIFVPKTEISINEAERKAYDLFLTKLSAIEGVEAVFDNLETLED